MQVCARVCARAHAFLIEHQRHLEICTKRGVLMLENLMCSTYVNTHLRASAHTHYIHLNTNTRNLPTRTSVMELNVHNFKLMVQDFRQVQTVEKFHQKNTQRMFLPVFCWVRFTGVWICNPVFGDIVFRTDRFACA